MFSLEYLSIPLPLFVAGLAVGLWFVWDMGQVCGEAIASRLGL